MIQNKHILLFIALQLIGGYLYAQATVKEVLDKSMQFYAMKDQYHIDMKFTMHRGLSGENPTESYEGSMQKKGEYIKNTALSTIVHQFQSAKVVIDESTKTMFYEKLEADAIQNAPINLNAFLEQYKKSQVHDNGSEWICEMVAETNNFVQTPYGKVMIYVDKDNFEIKKQVLFFTNRVPFNIENGSGTEPDFGRLVINLKYRDDIEIQPKQLKEFLVNDTGNALKLQEEYASYKLIDQTEYNK